MIFRTVVRGYVPLKTPGKEKKSVDDVRGFYADNGCLTFVDKARGQGQTLCW